MFTVADLDATVRFFTQVPDFTVRCLPAPSAEFMFKVTGIANVCARVAVVDRNDHAIELFQYDSPHDRSSLHLRTCDVGFSHIAFRVDDLDAAVARAAAHGFLPSRHIAEYRNDRLERRATYLRGPDGLAVELVETSAG